MKNRFDGVRRFPAAWRSVVAVGLALTMLVCGPHAHAQDRYGARNIVGTWYLALDAGAFDPGLAGTVLSGLAQFHPDRTFMVSDAGDFGADSFLPTLASPQYGAWRLRLSGSSWAREIVGTSIFIEAHKVTGEALGWNKVQFNIRMVGQNRAAGTISAFFLPCNDAPPIPSPLTCPDPVENAGSFIPASPPDVAITLRRIVAGR